MSEQKPRDFDKLEKATKKFQEEKYMDTLMGDAVGRSDTRSEQRRKEAKEYDDYLSNMDSNRKEHFEKSGKTYENMTPYELTYKIAEAKFHGDKATETSLYNALLDKIAEQEKKTVQPGKERDLFAEYDYRIDEIFQRLHEKAQSEKSQNENEEDAIRTAILDPENVRRLYAELNTPADEDAPASNDVPYDWAKDSEWPNEDAPASDDDEVTLIAPVVRGVSGSNAPTVVEEMPQNPAERQSWFRRNRNKILGAAAAFAIGLGTGFLMWGDKDNQRSGSPTKIGQPAKPNGKNPDGDNFMKKFKVNQADSHEGNKTVTKGFKGFEKNDSAKQATEQLKKNFNHHPTLLAEAVYAYQNGISVDKAREHVDEINKMAKSFIDGDHLSSEGQKWAEKLGKSIDNGSARWVTQDQMNHGIWYNSGIEENGKFDKFFINPNAGFNSNRILRVTLGNGKVIYLKANCINFLWKDQAQETSTSTGKGTVKITYGEEQQGTTKFEQPKRNHTDEKPGLTPKGPTQTPISHDNGNHLAPTGDPDTDNNSDGITQGNPTNPAPITIERPTPPPAVPEGIPNNTQPGPTTSPF